LPTDPVMREWVVVCEADELPACMVGWERPAGTGEERLFEMIWTVEPEVVREAARVTGDVIARSAPALVEDLRERLADAPSPAGEAQLRAAVELPPESPSMPARVARAASRV
jgi:MerR family transcriptional regulator, light-induced transcriptional regulator